MIYLVTNKWHSHDLNVRAQITCILTLSSQSSSISRQSFSRMSGCVTKSCTRNVIAELVVSQPASKNKAVLALISFKRHDKTNEFNVVDTFCGSQMFLRCRPHVWFLCTRSHTHQSVDACKTMGMGLCSLQTCPVFPEIFLCTEYSENVQPNQQLRSQHSCNCAKKIKQNKNKTLNHK